MMKCILPLLFLTTAAMNISAAPEAQGQLQMTGVSEQGDRSIKRPYNSQSQDAVLAQFGEPDSKVSAIGEPPITRWEYAKFNVFFEYDKVIHTVLKK